MSALAKRSPSPPCSFSNLSGPSCDSPSEVYHQAVVPKSSTSPTVSRCACHRPPATSPSCWPSNRRRCQMVESFSLTEIRSPATGASLFSEFEPTHSLSRSRSVQGTTLSSRLSPYLGGGGKATCPYAQQQHSHSDSSFNYESNMSEMDATQSKPVNYFEYRSLESITSPTVSDTTISQQGDNDVLAEGEEEEEEEANSTRVNFDEGSTFTSPREEELVAIEDGFYSPASYSVLIANHNLVNGGEKQVSAPPQPPSPREGIRSTPPPTPATTPVKTSSCSGSRPSSPSTATATTTTTTSSTSTTTFVNLSSVHQHKEGQRSSSGRKKTGGSKSKSQSARDRRRTRAQSNNKHASNEDVSVRSGKRTLGQQHQHQQAVHQLQQQQHPADWSILPIFKQLIVQKQLESGGTQSQPISSGLSDDERIMTTTTTTATIDEIDDGHRQMSSCPNLSIKCDVVEYF